MAIRYVKNFEFPSAAGYTDSATKVTGQMYAKGGDVKAPKGKGMMVVIGIGTPKKGPMKKAEGGSANAPGSNIPMDPDYMKRLGKSPGQGTPKKAAPKKPAPSTVPGSDIPTDDDYMKRLEDRQKYAKGGKAKMQNKIGKVMHEYKAGELHSGSKKGPMVKNPKQAIAIAISEGKKAVGKAKGGQVLTNDQIDEQVDDHYDNVFDMYVRDHGKSYADAKAKLAAEKLRQQLLNPAPMGKAKGGMAHEDVAEDKALIKKMVKPMALKAKGGYADGGMTAPSIPSPLQRMAMMQRAKAVPVAPTAPVISSGMASGTDIGVNQMRKGTRPNIGAIRAAMARAATRANPAAAPAAMKKGGKTKMDNC